VEALKLLRSVPMFKNWARSRLDRVVQLLHRKRVKAGTVIVKQGDPPDNVYFVFDGRCVVMKDLIIKSSNRWPSGPKSWTTKVRQTVQPFKVLEMGEGSFFGEKAIIEDSVRAATVIADTDCMLLLLDKVEFMGLLNAGHKMNDVYSKTQVSGWRVYCRDF
jgi:voltage-gated potassium channel